MKGLLKFTLLLCILKSMNHWLFWDIDYKIIYFITILTIIICIIHNKRSDC